LRSLRYGPRLLSLYSRLAAVMGGGTVTDIPPDSPHVRIL
jgi:hypothetical protein